MCVVSAISDTVSRSVIKMGALVSTLLIVITPPVGFADGRPGSTVVPFAIILVITANCTGGV